MNFSVLTLFPELIEANTNASILGRALKSEKISINTINIRDYAADIRRTCDDYPYGGGAGMLMKPDVIYSAFMSIPEEKRTGARVIYMSPQGKPFTQTMAEELSKEKNLIILCGHYEGIDERISEMIVTDEISAGDYILTGGELAACIVIDAVSRLVDGVLGKNESYENETFSDGLCEYPQYTRPPEFLGKNIPPVLLSGDHGKIEKWRREKAIQRTFKKRPDMLETAPLTKKEREEIRQNTAKQIRNIADILKNEGTISHRDFLFLLKNKSENVLEYLTSISDTAPIVPKILNINDKLKSKCLLERKEKIKCETLDIFGNVTSKNAKKFRLTPDTAAAKAQNLLSSGCNILLLSCVSEEFFNDDLLCDIVKSVKNAVNVPIAADFGIRSLKSVRRFYDSGADMYAFAPFTVSEKNFANIYRNNVSLINYLDFYRELKNAGIPLCSVLMSSIPYESESDIYADFSFLLSGNDMHSFFIPFEPLPDTEFSDFPKGNRLLCDTLNAMLVIGKEL